MPRQETIIWNEPYRYPEQEGEQLLMKVFAEENMGFISGMYQDDNYYVITCSNHYRAIQIPKENIIAWCYHPKGNVGH